MPLKAVLVGTGGWARCHAQAWKQTPGAELAGIVQPRPGEESRARLEGMAAEFGAPGSMDLEGLLRAVRPDIVDVACNPHFRLEAIRRSFAQGVSVFNVEKPLALTCREGLEIERFCREHGLKLTVNHQKKFMPGWRDVGRILRAGGLGEIEWMRGSCQGNVLEQGTHVVDMALFFNGYAPPRWVVGQIGGLEGLDKPGASAPDMALAEIGFDHGARCLIDFGTLGRDFPGEPCKWYRFGVDVQAERGLARATLNSGCSVRYFDGRPAQNFDSRWERDYTEGLVLHLASLVRYAQGLEPPIGRLENAMLSFKVIMGLYQSALSRSAVDLSAPLWPDVVERLEALRT